MVTLPDIVLIVIIVLPMSVWSHGHITHNTYHAFIGFNVVGLPGGVVYHVERGFLGNPVDGGGPADLRVVADWEQTAAPWSGPVP